MKIRTIPAGITWEKLGRNRFICTVRRMPEEVIEWEPSDYAAMNQAALANWRYNLYPLQTFSGTVGGLFGGIGL